MAELVKCSKCRTKILKSDKFLHESTCKKRKPVGECKHCNKEYKQTKALMDHEVKCKKRSKPPNPQRRKRRKSIDPYLRMKVWNTYIGQTMNAKCFCCWNNKITPFTYCNTFQAGHIKSHAHGGRDTIDNLLPICRDCNLNMSAEDWDDYIERHPHLPLRIYGANSPKKVIWATTIIQSLVRMWLERKNPDSAWRLRWQQQLKNHT